LHIGNIEAARNIFERVSSFKISSKKMKFILKRYLAFEKEHGDKDTIQHVKEKTLEYLEATT